MAGRYEPKDVDLIFRGLNNANESDRAVIAVAASLVEFALEQVIAVRLRAPSGKTEMEKLFTQNGILGTFSEKIWAAYFLKIVGPTARRDIGLIREIRNQAANDMNPISFSSTTEIASRCRELQLAGDAMADGKAPTDPRRRYLVAAAFFASNLMMRAGDEEAEISNAFIGRAPSLDR